MHHSYFCIHLCKPYNLCLLADRKHSYINRRISQKKTKGFPPQDTEGTKKNLSHSFTAVRFSENMEVFIRLACAFWPGPVKIFAPVRMCTKNSDTKTATQSTSEKLMSLNGNDNSVPPPSSSNSNLQNDGKGGSVMVKKMIDKGDPFPIFPSKVLSTHTNLFGRRSENEMPLFIGFRCPSHPLTNRVLKEAYSNGTIKGKKPHGKGNHRRRLQGAIFGSPIHGQRLNCHAETAMDVCTNIISHTQHQCEEEVDRQTVYVLNGEDKREIFHVSACQFSNVESVSLVINTLNRTVSIIRPLTSCGKKASPDSSSGITVETVELAIHICKPCEGEILKSMIVASVMRRWKVLEFTSCQ